MKDIKITQLLTKRTFILERYLSEIARYPLLSLDEEVSLAKRVREGDRAAMEKLIRCNLRFVVSVAKKYQDLGVDLEDLISEGNVGLIKAAERFDETKGFKFISFAVWWIRQCITMGLSEKRRIVRLPGNILTGYTKIYHASSALEKVLERVPTLQEIAEYADLPEEKVIGFMNTSSSSVSLDRPRSADDQMTLMDILENPHSIAPDHDLMENSIKTDVQRLMRKLSPRQRQIIYLFYGLNGGFPMTMEDIAEQLKISAERVRQIRTAAMETLRERAREELRSYL